MLETRTKALSVAIAQPLSAPSACIRLGHSSFLGGGGYMALKITDTHDGVSRGTAATRNAPRVPAFAWGIRRYWEAGVVWH
jgi:hypothetical protein